MNHLADETCIKIGINEWFAPQISEHCPENIPSRLGVLKIWLIRPGRASTLVPKEGTVHEWMTSSDVTIIRVVTFTGIVMISLVLIKRKMFEASIKFSVSLFFSDKYS